MATWLPVFPQTTKSTPCQDKISECIRFDRSGNKDFIEQLFSWTFQEKSVLKVDSFDHHKIGEKAKRELYRIKDDLVRQLSLFFRLILI